MAEGKGMDADDAMAFTHIAETAVSAYADASFSRVRQADGVLGDFLAPVSAFDFSKLAKGDGKGGNLMGFTPDKRFIVKEMSGDDHASLLQIAGAYVDHVLDPAGSLLCHFYAHFAYEGKNYVVMNNLLTDPPGTYTAQYDLKGCADDKTLLRDGLRIKSVHKRFYNPKMWFGKVAWSEGRRVYHKNKVLARTDEFHVTGPQYVSFVRMLERDCAFLAGHNLMDYSLLVGVQSKPIAEAQGDANIAAEQVEDMVGGPRFMPTLSVAPGRLAGAGGEAQYLSVGIIDFLQDWNIKKKIARKFKVLERNKATIPPPRYGARFASYFGDKFVADSEPLELVREPAAGTAGTAEVAGAAGGAPALVFHVEHSVGGEAVAMVAGTEATEAEFGEAEGGADGDGGGETKAEAKKGREAKGDEYEVVLPAGSKLGMGLTHCNEKSSHFTNHGNIGCRVTTVQEGSAAAETGKILPHDWILAVNGTNVSHGDEKGVFEVLKGALVSGEAVTMRFRRAGIVAVVAGGKEGKVADPGNTSAEGVTVSLGRNPAHSSVVAAEHNDDSRCDNQHAHKHTHNKRTTDIDTRIPHTHIHITRNTRQQGKGEVGDVDVHGSEDGLQVLVDIICVSVLSSGAGVTRTHLLAE